MPRRWVWIAAVIFALDQGTKLWAVQTLQLGESLKVLGEFVRLTRMHNPGAAFGLFPQGTIAFLAASVVVALGLCVYLLVRRPAGAKLWGSAFILGGALGNLVDRARLGYVLDLFAVGNFPVFNVADSALVLGMGLLVLGIAKNR